MASHSFHPCASRSPSRPEVMPGLGCIITAGGTCNALQMCGCSWSHGRWRRGPVPADVMSTAVHVVAWQCGRTCGEPDPGTCVVLPRDSSSRTQGVDHSVPANSSCRSNLSLPVEASSGFVAESMERACRLEAERLRRRPPLIWSMRRQLCFAPSSLPFAPSGAMVFASALRGIGRDPVCCLPVRQPGLNPEPIRCHGAVGRPHSGAPASRQPVRT